MAASEETTPTPDEIDMEDLGDFYNRFIDPRSTFRARSPDGKICQTMYEFGFDPGGGRCDGPPPTATTAKKHCTVRAAGCIIGDGIKYRVEMTVRGKQYSVDATYLYDDYAPHFRDIWISPKKKPEVIAIMAWILLHADDVSVDDCVRFIHDAYGD